MENNILLEFEKLKISNDKEKNKLSTLEFFDSEKMHEILYKKIIHTKNKNIKDGLYKTNTINIVNSITKENIFVEKDSWCYNVSKRVYTLLSSKIYSKKCIYVRVIEKIENFEDNIYFFSVCYNDTCEEPYDEILNFVKYVLLKFSKFEFIEIY